MVDSYVGTPDLKQPRRFQYRSQRIWFASGDCHWNNVILEWNPRGQVAPQVIVTNVATKQTDKGVAPQSPLEESSTTSARWHRVGVFQ